MYINYFGYGANQNIDYFINRYNKYNIDILGKFFLKKSKFKLIYSPIIDSVIATIIPDNNSIVFGILYKIPYDMIKDLDKQEHVDKRVYYKKNIINTDICFYIYIAKDTNIIKNANNSNKYKKLIINGLINNKFPYEYIEYINKCFNNIK